MESESLPTLACPAHEEKLGKIRRCYAEHVLEHYRHRKLSVGQVLAAGQPASSEPWDPELDEVYVEPRLAQGDSLVPLCVDVAQVVEDLNHSNLEAHQRTEPLRRLLRHEAELLANNRSCNPSYPASQVLEQYWTLLILGEPGSGKSTLLRFCLLQRAQVLLEEPVSPVPVLLSLADFAAAWSGSRCATEQSPQKTCHLPARPSLLPPASFAAAEIPGNQGQPDTAGTPDLRETPTPASRRGGSAPAADNPLPAVSVTTEFSLESYLCDPSRECVEGASELMEAALQPDGTGLVLLLDGLNEISPTAVPAVSALLHAFVQQHARPGQPSRVYITDHYNDERYNAIASVFESRTLLPFNDLQLQEYARQWCHWLNQSKPATEPTATPSKEEALNLMERWMAHPRTAQLIRSPLALAVVAATSQVRTPLPKTRGMAFQEALERQVAHWAQRRSRSLQRPVEPDVDLACRLWAPIARWMHSQALTAAPQPELLERLRHQLERLGMESAAEVWLDPEGGPFCTCAPHREGQLSFLHPIFGQYLAAQDLYHIGEWVPELDQYLAEERWHEVLRLTAGYLANRSDGGKEAAVDLLLRVLNAGSLHEGLLHRDLFLAASCLAEVAYPHGETSAEVIRQLLVAASAPENVIFHVALDHLRKAAGPDVDLSPHVAYLSQLIHRERFISWEDGGSQIGEPLAYWLAPLTDPLRIPHLQALSEILHAEDLESVNAGLVCDRRHQESAHYFRQRMRGVSAWVPTDGPLVWSPQLSAALEPALAGLLADTEARVRLVAAGRLRAGLHAPAALAALLALLADEDPFIRKQAVCWLRESAPQSLLETALHDLMYDHEPSVRLEAALSLQEGTHAEAADEAMAELIAGDPVFSPHYATRGLLTPAVEAALTDILTDSPPWIQFQLADQLRHGPLAPVVEALLERSLEHAEPHVRQRAAVALRRSGTAEAQKSLVGLLADQSPFVQYHAATSLRGGPHAEEAEAVLAGLLTSLEPSIRLHVAMDLLGGPFEEIAGRTLLSLEGEEADSFLYYAALGRLLHGPCATEAGAELLRRLESVDPRTQHLAGGLLHQAPLTFLPRVEALLRERNCWPPDCVPADHPLRHVAFGYAARSVEP